MQSMSARAIRRSFPYLALVLASLAAATPLHAQGRFDEREIKATFLFNFTQFVEWPPASFADAQAPMVIGILGDDPFGRTLDDAVAGENTGNRPLAVARFRRIEDVTTCHILFISSSQAAQYGAVIAAVRGQAILTVGDEAGFTEAGGMIRFVTENNHVRLQVNAAAVRAAGMTVSSRLLRISQIVGPDANP
jgi:hypothetical protein